MITIPTKYFFLAIGLNKSRDATKNCSTSENASLGIAFTEPYEKEIMP